MPWNIPFPYTVHFLCIDSSSSQIHTWSINMIKSTFDLNHYVMWIVTLINSIPAWMFLLSVNQEPASFPCIIVVVEDMVSAVVQKQIFKTMSYKWTETTSIDCTPRKNIKSALYARDNQNCGWICQQVQWPQEWIILHRANNYTYTEQSLCTPFYPDNYF